MSEKESARKVQKGVCIAAVQQCSNCSLTQLVAASIRIARMTCARMFFNTRVRRVQQQLERRGYVPDILSEGTDRNVFAIFTLTLILL